MRRESLLLTSYSSTGLPKVLVYVKKQHSCDEGSKGRRTGAVSPYFCWTG